VNHMKQALQRVAADQREWLMQQPMRVICQECDWTFEGDAQSALGASKLHRTKHGRILEALDGKAGR
jgi:hypothetical protein